MKKLLGLTLVAAAALGLAAALPATAPAVPSAVVDGPLEEAMESMNGALKSLLKGVDASTKDKALENVARMQGAIVAAKVEKPKDLSAEELVGYRKLLVELLGATCKLEVALLDGKFDEANKIAKDELTRFKKEGHDKYQKEEEGGGK